MTQPEAARVERGPITKVPHFALGMAALLERQGFTVAANELRRLHAEVEEQCRLNGMGSEREAKLMAENNALRATLGALHYHCKFGDGLMASTIVDECERAVPKLAAIDAAKERT